MCLRIETDRIIANEDIPCYKVVCWSNGTYFTPYSNAIIDDECITNEKPFIAEGIKEIKLDTRGAWVGEGQIHTFKNFDEAFWLAKSISLVTKIFYCIIPEGTEFFVGIDESTDSKAYCSDKIIFKKEITQENFSEFLFV